ncbi:MAG TPA: S9 family peptidase [Planctomycetota bacterium]|nr:S9 family peptidase [Planctomycetota bacterium]
MKRLAWLVLLAGCAAGETPVAPPAVRAAAPARVPAPGVPPAIATEGVPPVSAAVAGRLAQYQSARGATFEDWGPGGSLLISTRFADTAQLHVVPFAGGRREQITFSDEPVSSGLFVPGSGDVLYSQARGGNENWQIFRLDRQQGRSTLLTDGTSRNGMGPLSRKGDRLVYSSNRANGRDMDLYLLDLASGKSSLLLEAKGSFWSVADWSPDDRALLLVKVVSVNDSRPYRLDLTTPESKPTSLLLTPDVRWSCSSPRFALGGAVMGSDLRSEFQQFTRDTGRVGLGASQTDVLDQPWDVTEIDVHGDRIAYVKNEDGASKIYFYGEGLPLEIPIGVVSGIKFSPDGAQLAFTLSRPDAPADAYSWDVAGHRLVRWTYSEVGGLDPSTFVVPRRISYPSFDGRTIPAYLYQPKGTGKVPVVISIHGGPEAQFQPFFSPLIQYWVNELGLAVLAPNVRGSTGYGKTYTQLDNAEKREDSVQDIGALLDWIAKQPDLDASRVAVHGGSYGGYMVLASLVHFGDRIKAGVDIVGIANFTTFLEKTSGYRVDLRRVEYGDERDPKMREVFERISPANHAEKIRSALLVAHGRNDPRVPFSEAEQIVAKVRANGRPVWTVYADNEGHGFARKENRDYFSAATTLFFQKHLLD